MHILSIRRMNTEENRLMWEDILFLFTECDCLENALKCLKKLLCETKPLHRNQWLHATSSISQDVAPIIVSPWATQGIKWITTFFFFITVCTFTPHLYWIHYISVCIPMQVWNNNNIYFILNKSDILHQGATSSLRLQLYLAYSSRYARSLFSTNATASSAKQNNFSYMKGNHGIIVQFSLK